MYNKNGENQMNRLKELREDRDLYQKANYSKYELEKINIPREALEKLAEFYGTSVDYILYRTDKKDAYPKSIVHQ